MPNFPSNRISFTFLDVNGKTSQFRKENAAEFQFLVQMWTHWRHATIEATFPHSQHIQLQEELRLGEPKDRSR